MSTLEWRKEYNKRKRSEQKPSYEKLFKMLLVMNQYGIYLSGRDGHIWIEQAEVDYPIKLETVALNSKIYGGVFEAIQTLNEALIRDGQDGLLDWWDEMVKDVLFLGDGGVAESRIDRVSMGKGGIY